MTTYTVTDGQSQSLSLSNYTSQLQNDTINVSGVASLYLGTPRGNTVKIDTNLAPNTTLTSNLVLDSTTVLKVTGDSSAKLILSSLPNYLGASTLFNVDVFGPGGLTVNGSGSVEFARGVSSDVSLGSNAGGAQGASIIIDQPNAFKGSISSQSAVIHLKGLADATDYDYSNGVLTIYGGADDAVLDTVRIAKGNSDFSITHNGSEVNIDGSNGPRVPVGTALPQHVAHPVTQPPVPQIVSVHDNTTGADLPDTSSPYTGPVAGVASQFINVTPDNLNVMAKADNVFIKTGAGNDAVALHGGTNVVDAGGGSNFLTGADGFDTFFLDARAIPPASSAAGPVPGAIWDTIENFGTGDAATLFGVGPGAAFSWQRDGGAAGHTGLTLHAIKQNGTTASLTLAGIDNGSHLQLSFGQTGGANYLYVKAV